MNVNVLIFLNISQRGLSSTMNDFNKIIQALPQLLISISKIMRLQTLLTRVVALINFEIKQFVPIFRTSGFFV